MGSADFPAAKGVIRSAIGFVNFSTTELPMLHKYQAWVRPVGGSTFNGHTITNWYSPGYYEDRVDVNRSEEHTSELQSLMRLSYAVFCLKKNTDINIMID